jgi:hypothetical protein
MRRLLRSGLKCHVERKKCILDLVAISVNFSHTVRCHITGQNKVKAIPVQALGVAVRVPTQSKVIFVMFSRHRKKTPFIHSFVQGFVHCTEFTLHPKLSTPHVTVSICLLSTHGSYSIHLYFSKFYLPSCSPWFSFHDSLFTACRHKLMSICESVRGGANWFRHCATSQKVAGSIPDGVIGILHGHNPSGHTMALGLTQPLTTRNISWG